MSMGGAASGAGAGATFGPWGAAIGAGLGAIAGGAGSPSSSSSRVDTMPASGLENSAGQIQTKLLRDYNDLVSKGASSGDVSKALGSQRDLASMLQQYSQTGGIPNQAEMSKNLDAAKLAYSGQQVAINQSLEQSRQAYARQAAISGRSATDPVFMGMLGQERQRAQERLGAQESQFAAFGLPQQRLGYASQLADVRNNLASQAMSNRQALMGLGNQVVSQERNWRMGSAGRTTEGSQGGGLGGALSGAIGGFGAAMGAGSNFGLFNSTPQSFGSGGQFQNTTGGGIFRGINNYNSGGGAP